MTQSKQKRTFPPFYEKVIPIAISILAIIVFAVVAFAAAIATGLLSF